jgi:hypothetical protein
MGVPRHARSALRTTKTQQGPAGPIPVPQARKPSPAASGGTAGPVPPPHDAHCVYAQLLIQLRWQLADARRENGELTASLRRLLQQIQGLNSVLDSYTRPQRSP